MSSVSGRSTTHLLAAVALLSLSACRTPMSAVELIPKFDRGLPELGNQVQVDTEIGPIQLEYADQDAKSAEVFRDALQRAIPKLVRWGKLDAPLRIFLVDRQQLEWFSGSGYEWLRAWARHDDVLFRTPSDFPVRPPTSGELEEIIAHEVTHALMFQRAATTTTWRRKEIPFWFREGMALATAGQGYEYPAMEDVARFYRSRPDLDPISTPEPLYQGEQKIVYGSALHAFNYLVKRNGPESVDALLDRMAEGNNFNEAFAQVVGQTPREFLAEFKGFVTTGAFKAPPKFVEPRDRRPPEAQPEVTPDSPETRDPAAPAGAGSTASPDAGP